MNIKLLFALVVVAFIGCATSTFVSGRDFDLSKADSIQKGKTTKQDVRALFGEPEHKSSNNYVETWMYQYIKSVGRATSFLVVTNATGQTYYKSLIITFDTTGTAQSVTQSISGNTSVYDTK